jgi:serine/threonine protein kinase
MYKILNHPNIPTIDNVGIGYASHYREYVHFHMKNLIPLDRYYEEIKNDTITKWKIFRDITGVVMYLSYKGIYHQNIKPSNILIDPDTRIAYLSDYSYAGSSFTMRSGWVDPEISEYFYNNSKTPPATLMIGGEIWSLGLLGVWLFIDSEIYKWSAGADDECMDIVYLLKGRFGSGLRNAQFNLDEVDNDLINTLDKMMGSDFEERLRALRKIKPVTNEEINSWGDRISLTKFNKMSFKERKEYVFNMYEIKRTVDKGIRVNTRYSEPMYLNDYIEMMKQIPLINKKGSIEALRDILNITDNLYGVENRVKITTLLYDHILPQCFDHIDNYRFWSTAVSKLEEFKEETKVDMTGLYNRNIGKLREACNSYKQY